MRSVDEAIKEREVALNGAMEAQKERFSAWMSAYIAETEEVQVESTDWEITVGEDGSFFPAYRVHRFSIETEQGWTELTSAEEQKEDDEPTVEEHGLGWLSDEDEEAPIDTGPGFVCSTVDVDAKPTWAVYAWQAYSGNRYCVEVRDSFVDACVCASELGPYR